LFFKKGGERKGRSPDEGRSKRGRVLIFLLRKGPALAPLRKEAKNHCWNKTIKRRGRGSPRPGWGNPVLRQIEVTKKKKRHTLLIRGGRN